MSADERHPLEAILPDIDPGGEPPVVQITTAVHHGISRGVLPPDLRMPTVRALAGTLSVAVNTVAKAYRRLEDDGSLISRGRSGTFVALGASERDAELAQAVSRLVVAARHCEADWETVSRMLKPHFRA